jgi:hypothetical protein
MLKLRQSKRSDSRDLADEALRFDIHDGGLAIGRLVYDRRRPCGSFNVGESEFTIEHTVAAPGEHAADEAATQATSSPRFSLRNADGALLAGAERERDVFIVGWEGEIFILQACRSRLYLYLQREGDVVSLGRVGKPGFWTSSLEVNLQKGFATSFQVFLASLLLDRIARRDGCQ